MSRLNFFIIALFGASVPTIALAQMSPEDFLAGYKNCQDTNTSPTVFTNCMNKLMADKEGKPFTPITETAPKKPASNATVINKCKGEWPTDFEMQEHCQKKQYEALSKWEVVSKTNDELLGQAVAKCDGDWPNDFEMKYHCYEKQGEGLKKLSDYFDNTDPQIQSIATVCVAEWVDDFEMAEYCTAKQVAAYNRLNP